MEVRALVRRAGELSSNEVCLHEVKAALVRQKVVRGLPACGIYANQACVDLARYFVQKLLFVLVVSKIG